MKPDVKAQELSRSRALRDLAWRCADEHQAYELRREADAILQTLEAPHWETAPTIADAAR